MIFVLSFFISCTEKKTVITNSLSEKSSDCDDVDSKFDPNKPFKLQNGDRGCKKK